MQSSLRYYLLVLIGSEEKIPRSYIVLGVTLKKLFIPKSSASPLCDAECVDKMENVCTEEFRLYLTCGLSSSTKMLCF